MDCKRCGKNGVGIHTCTPSDQWRAGFEYATVQMQKRLIILRDRPQYDPMKIDDVQKLVDEIKMTEYE